MPLIIPASGSSTNNQGGGGLGPLSRIYAEYENSQKVKKLVVRKRSRSADRKGCDDGFGDGKKKKKRSSEGVSSSKNHPPPPQRPTGLKERPINTTVNNVNVATTAAAMNGKRCLPFQKQPPPQCSRNDCTKMALQRKEGGGGFCQTHVIKPTPCNYFGGCTDNSIKDGLCKTHWCAVNLCAHDGCVKLASKDGLCKTHWCAVNLCAHDGCVKLASKDGKGLCREHRTPDHHDVKEVRTIELDKKTKKQQKQNVCAVKQSSQRKRCITEGCSNQSVINGVCFRHGAKRKLCVADGSTNHSIRAGVCFRHGAKRKLCYAKECTNLAQRKGACVRHGAFVVGNSYEEEEEEEANNGGPALCVAIPPLEAARGEQGEKQRYKCSFLLCTSGAAADGEVCVRHRALSSMDDPPPPSPATNPVIREGCTLLTQSGRKAKLCKSEGCTNRAIQGGQCFRHGAKAHRKLCSSEGCKNYVVRGGICIKHGAKQVLMKNPTEEEDETPVQSLKQEEGETHSSVVDDGEEKKRQDEIYKSIDQLEDSCAGILLLLKKDG